MNNISNQLQLTLENITVKLPESHIIVQKEEYERLLKENSQGKWLQLKDIVDLLSVSRPWLLENILYKPEIRSQIDIEQNPNGFVKYPENQGGRYFFLASQTRKYFDKNFATILTTLKKK
ncbi:DUF771 domain-containing protein [Streptococcus pneumoniae]